MFSTYVVKTMLDSSERDRPLRSDLVITGWSF